jgi:hypothetical protein
MTTIQIETLRLSIADVIQIIFNKKFYYKITKEGERRVLETSYSKEDGKGWKFCTKMSGGYCGDRYFQGNEGLQVIKVRTNKPFRMGNYHYNYLEFSPSVIKSITVTKRVEPTILDRVAHAVKTKGKKRAKILS